jgi:hypothetical protein
MTKHTVVQFPVRFSSPHSIFIFLFTCCLIVLGFVDWSFWWSAGVFLDGGSGGGALVDAAATHK